MGKRGNSEGSIYKDKQRERWVARVTTGDGTRKTFYGRTREEVAGKLANALSAVQAGLPIPGGQLTVAKFLSEWLEQSARPKLKPATYRSYEGLVRVHIVPSLGRIRLVKLTPQQVQAFLNRKHAAGASARRVQMMHDVLRAALNRAVKWQLVGRNVVDLVDTPRVPAPVMHPLTPEQATAFLAAARGHEYEHLYALLLTTGLRLGEALALRWKTDVDEQARALSVRHTLEWLSGQPWTLADPKAASARRGVPLIAPSIAALRGQRARQKAQRQWAPVWTDHDLVFTDEIGEPVRARRAHSEFKKLLAAAGLPNSHRPHDLRHSMATYLVAAGVNERVVMEILGHSTLAMTQRYSHVLGPMMADAADRLDALWARTAGTS